MSLLLESATQITEAPQGHTPGPGWPSGPLATARQTLEWLCAGPEPLRLDLGSAATHLDTAQPVGGIAVDTLAAWLTTATVSPTARDAIWGRLILRAWAEPIPWRIVAVAVAEPALRALIEELLSLPQPDHNDDREDGHGVGGAVESSVLTAFLEALAPADPVRPGVWPRLLSQARRAGRAALEAERNAPVPIGLDPLAARPPGLSAMLTMTAPVTSGGLTGIALDVLLAGAVGDGVLSEPEADALREAARRAKNPHTQDDLPPRRAASLRRIEWRLADHLYDQLTNPTPTTRPIGTRPDRSDDSDRDDPDLDCDDPDLDGDDRGGSGHQREAARDGGAPAGAWVSPDSSASSDSSGSGTGSQHHFSSPRPVGQRDPRNDGAADEPRTGERRRGWGRLPGARLRDRLTRWSLDGTGVGPGALAVLVVLTVAGLAAYVAMYLGLIRAVVTGVTGVPLGPPLPCLALPGAPEPVAMVSALLSSSGAGGPGFVAQAPIVPVGSVDAVLTNIRNFLLGILVALATVFATFGGVRYVMSGGEPGEVEKAKNALRSAAIGFALAALAPLVIEILRGLVSA